MEDLCDHSRYLSVRFFPFREQTPNVLPAIDHGCGVTFEEFDALKKEVQELKKLIEAAKQFDAATGQPDCEMEQKVKKLRLIAELVREELNL